MAPAHTARRSLTTTLLIGVSVAFALLFLLASPQRADAGNSSFADPMGRLNWGGGYYTAWTTVGYGVFCEEPYATDAADAVWWRRTRYDAFRPTSNYQTAFAATDYFTSTFQGAGTGYRCAGTVLRTYLTPWSVIELDGYTGTPDSPQKRRSYTG